MSNSIWKAPGQKPDKDKKEFSSFPRQVVACHISSYGIEWGVTPVSLYNPTIKIEKWCYLDDLIAQADKAERLEEENEAMREEFEVWHGNHKCVLEDKERLQKQLDSLKKYSDSLRHRVEKMLKKNKILKNTASDYFIKSIELGIELEKTKSNN